MKIYSNYTRYIVCAVCMLTGSFQSCKKAVEVSSPNSSLIGQTVYTDPKTALAVMTGIYDNMHGNTSFTDGNYDIATFMGLASDEMKNYYPSTTSIQYYTNSLLASNTNYNFWPQFYQFIYVANSVIQGSQNSSLPTPVKQQLEGEAKFMRAFLNFYAVNLYGDVPIVTSTDYVTNNVIKKSPQADVYQAIIGDLVSAQAMLTDDYKDADNNSTGEKTRPNKATATALLARAYLYAGDYKNAELQASSLINNASYSLLPDLNGVFLANSDEAIWQLASVNPTITNTLDGYYYILKSTPGGINHVTLSNNIINAFEDGDSRKANWIGIYKKGITNYYYAYKYKNNVVGSSPTEYLMMLRLGEQYLIRAEARAQQNEPDALDDLNAIRTRAGLDNYAGATDKISVLNAILHERQVELFSEWAHRWFDLKRTGNLDSVMGGPNGACAAKGGTWKTTDALLPIPLSETIINPNLKQNPGY